MGTMPALPQQGTTPTPGVAGKPAFVLVDFFQDAIQAAPGPFQPALQSLNVNFAPTNSAIATQLSNLPILSPASAVRYTFNRELGVHVPSVQSLGPVLAERAETIGRGKFFLAITYQSFSFDQLDDSDQRRIEVGFPITAPPGLFPSTQLLVTGEATIRLTISQTTALLTYGLTHRLDLSYAFPVVRSDIGMRAEGRLVEPVGGQVLQSIPRRWAAAASTGLGDGIARVKARLITHGKMGLALATDIRLPTGDEFNYHGAGAYGIKPFLAASFTTGSLSPHVNIGYQWNGSSYLASPTLSEKRQLPGQIFYAVGAESGISPRFTLAFDFLDQLIINAQRSFRRDVEVSGKTYSTLYYTNQSRHEYNASVGFKAALRPDVVLTGNILLRLNKAGLRAPVVPLVGLSYVF